ncbi:hypothetical protein OH784_14575 [Ectobacillus funiculus]|uniref:hypothetical protein n=1 Tax=Ectobacillus funiculus TaxID=137993 RepID=UPI00397A15D7
MFCIALEDDNNLYIGGSFNTSLLNSDVIPSAIDTKSDLNHDAYDVINIINPYK